MQATYMNRSIPNLNIIYGSGRNSSFVIQELIMQHFCVFQKINFQNFSVTWNKINSNSDLLISYPSITQTQIKHSLPMSFKFRVNPYVKTILSKTWENSRLESQVLERNYNRATIHHFHLRDHSESSLFANQLLKIEIKVNQTHTFHILLL